MGRVVKLYLMKIVKSLHSKLSEDGIFKCVFIGM